MRTVFAVVMVGLVGLAGCMSEEPDASNVTAPPPTPPTPPIENVTANETLDAEVDPNSLPGTRFLAIGDQGSGKESQFKVAAAMEAVCIVRGCDFVAALGDNIYDTGPSSVDDEQFETKFEQPYANFDIPFYLAQGNHDNSGDPGTQAAGQEEVPKIGHYYEGGNFEVDYHYKENRTSDKWHMPARFYDVAIGNVTLLVSDTNLLMYWGFGYTSDTEDVPTPEEQDAWFDEAVASATTPWIISAAHHPYISNGEHGDAGDYESSQYGQDRPDDSVPRPDPVSGPMVEAYYEDHVCGNVDIILTGHDHDLQWLQEHPECPGAEQIVSGAASKTRSAGNEERNPAHFQKYDTLGFVWFEATETTLTGVFYDGDGNELFERTLTKQA